MIRCALDDSLCLGRFNDRSICFDDSVTVKDSKDSPRQRNNMSNTTSPGALSFEATVCVATSVLIGGALITGLCPKPLLRVLPDVVLVMLLVLVLSVIVLSTITVNDSVLVSLSVDSEALQTIYLPPLITSELLKLNLRSFRVAFWQIQWLVFPGVIVGCGLTALFPLYLLPGSKTFGVYESFAFAGMLSTTDPIAVLMALNELGAPKRLGAVMGGESLLNDGSSIIIVTLFLMLLDGRQMTAGDIVGFAVRELLLGFMFGVAVGLVTLVFMRMLRDHAVALVTLSLAVPYFVFTISLYYLDTSGVLALIPVGLLINRFGRTFLSRHLEAVEAFWAQVEFFAGTLLYAQAGLFLATDFTNGAIVAGDWLSLFCLYLWITMVRFIVVFGSFPLLKRIGYGMSWQEAVVVWHGGLRGAVGILLSFTIRAAPGVTEESGTLTIFFMAGIVILMLFNVVTTGPLCRWLNLTFSSKGKRTFHHLRHKLYDDATATLERIGIGNETSAKVMGSVTSRKTANSKSDSKPIFSRYLPSRLIKGGGKDDEEEEEVESDDDDPYDGNAIITSQQVLGDSNLARQMVKHNLTGQWINTDVLNRKRRTYCLAVQAIYESLLETQLVNRLGWFFLSQAAERKLDLKQLDEVLQFQEVISGSWVYGGIIRFLLWSRGVLTKSCLYLDRERNGQAYFDELLFEVKVIQPKGSMLEKLNNNSENSHVGRFGEKIEDCEGFAVGDDVEKGLSKEAFMDFAYLIETFASAAWAFIVANQRASRLINEIFAENSTTDGGITKLRFQSELDALRMESQAACERPASFLNLAFEKFPSVLRKIKRRQALHFIKSHNRHMLGRFKRNGLIEPVELKQMLSRAERMEKKISKLEFNLVPPYYVGQFGTSILQNPNFANGLIGEAHVRERRCAATGGDGVAPANDNDAIDKDDDDDAGQEEEGERVGGDMLNVQAVAASDDATRQLQKSATSSETMVSAVGTTLGVIDSMDTEGAPAQLLAFLAPSEVEPPQFDALSPKNLLDRFLDQADEVLGANVDSDRDLMY